MGKKLTIEKASEAVSALQKHGTTNGAARALGISRATMQGRIAAVQNYYPHLVKAVPLEAAQEVAVPTDAEAELRDRVYELETALKSVRAETLDDDYVKRKIIGLTRSLADARPPEWALIVPVGQDLPGIPSVMWSDWHWGEVVFPAQVNGVNKYNLEIAHARAKRLVEKTLALLMSYEVRPEYPGIVCNLGGDMLTGDIHDELKETNEVPNMVALLDLFGVLVWALTTLADAFDHVFVPCVTGNHGRNTHKPRAKHRNFTNFDWLLYQFLARHFADDPRIQFYIPDGSDAWYQVQNHRYLLTHGDQFRGGDGIIGALGPITRGNQKKQARNTAIELSYDTMILGHWHQYIPKLDIIVNGSLKGYDEYAMQGNFGFQLPIQALWTTHHHLGINMMRPIYLEDRKPAGKASGNWVSWKDAA